MNAANMTPSLFTTMPSSSSKEVQRRKEAELKLAVHVACHSSFKTMDHLGEVVKEIAGSSQPLGSIKMHRTKCTKLINQVVAPALAEELKKDAYGKAFSLIIDESTDVSVDKNLAIVIRYYSVKRERIHDEFLAMVTVIQTTGEALFEAISSVMNTFGLDYSNLDGLGTDGASSMVGEWNSLWSPSRFTRLHVV